MASSFKDLTPAFQKEIEQKSTMFLRAMMDQIDRTAQPKTPASAKNPRLRNDILKQVLGLNAKMVWNKVYARYQEAGQRADGSRKVKNYTTPGTGPHFAENAVEASLGFVGEIARKVGLA